MAKTKVIVWSVIIGIVVLITGSYFVSSSIPGPYDEFAACLGEEGYIMYGAWWCPHCEAQKDLFGRSAKKIPYIECSTNSRSQTEFCNNKGIEAYPTWEYPDGTREVRTHQLQELSELSGCPLN